MAYLPCHKQTSRTYVITFGPNTPNKSPTILQSPRSTNFNPHLMAPYSTVRTNMPLHFVSTVHVSTTNPLKIPFKIHPFSNNYQMNHPPLCPHWSNLSIANMAKLILGQSAPAANFHQGTSWQNERRIFEVVDPSSPSLTLPFDLCSIFLPDSSSNSSLLPVPTTSLQETSTPYCPFCGKHLSMLTSFWSTKIWQASLPVLTKTDLSAPGSYSWTFFVLVCLGSRGRRGIR